MIQYKVITRKNPQNEAAPPKYYLSPVSSGTIDLDDLSRLLSDGSTVRQADVYAVLIGLVNIISVQLKEGKRIRLGKLGSFSVGLRSGGVESEKDASPRQIKRCQLIYRASPELKALLKTLEFEKLS